MILIPVPVAGGPSWADIMTAFGTVGAVIAAVSIALWADWRSARRIREERERSDRQLEAEQERSDRQLKEERERSQAQIEEERWITREREQLAEAYAVQIVSARASVSEVYGHSDPEDPSMCPMAIMVNHGLYAVTRVEARFSNGRTTYRANQTHHLSAFSRLPDELKGAEDHAMPWPEDLTVVSLTPQDPGLRLIGPAVLVRQSLDDYPIVRWTDRWGTRWEHRRGEVRQVRDDEEWAP